MRRAIAACLVLGLAACLGGGNDGECKVDTDCGGAAVCARSSECLPSSEVRVVRVTWTIRGEPASASNCAATPDFYLKFAGGYGDTYGYAPVPCRAGLFTVDKLPRRYVSVEIGADNRFAKTAAFDANGNVAFDLSP